MKSQTISYAFIIGLIACGSSIFAQSTQPGDALPKLPAPSGPFGIGRVGHHWVDPLRPDRYSSDPNKHRELMVYFWYPTSGKSADAEGSYFPGAQRMNTVPLRDWRNSPAAIWSVEAGQVTAVAEYTPEAAIHQAGFQDPLACESRVHSRLYCWRSHYLPRRPIQEILQAKAPWREGSCVFVTQHVEM